MTSMSDWSRGLAAEVKAAAPNAPEPNHMETAEYESLWWENARGHAVLTVRLRGDIPEWLSWSECLPRPWWQCWFGLANNDDERLELGLTPRAYFVRLVKEMWP